MKKILLAIFLINCVYIIAIAQDVVISTEKWDEMRDERKAKSDSIILLISQIESLRQDSLQFEQEIATLRQQINSNDSLMNVNNSLVQDTVRLSETIVQLNSTILSLRENSDRNLARLANGRLQRKYNKEQVDQSLLDLGSITTPEINQKFNKVRELLILYPSANNIFKSILISAQADPRRKSSANMQQYTNDYLGQIKGMSYYNTFYLKRNQNNFWSIPYLNEMIDAAISILQKHNPGREDYADFTALIELL